MRKIAAWGRANPWTARITLIVSRIILFWLAVYLGSVMIEEGYSISQSFLYLLAAVAIYCGITYPAKTTRKTDPFFFRRQKIRDLLISVTCFGMIMGLVQDPSALMSPITGANAATHSSISKGKEKPRADEILASLKHRDKKTLTRQEKRILRQEFKKQLKIFAISTIRGDQPAKADAGLKILAIVAAIGLLLLVGAIACELSCNGSDAAAIIVGVLGTAAVIIGLVAVLKAINRKQQKQVKENNES
jgi:hypothetical protein